MIMDTFINRFEFTAFLLSFVALVGVTGVHINDLRVPSIIRNGTEEWVTLDCDYTLEENEKAGLVVKWYLNNEESPVYQWIPNQRPQDLGVLRGRLNLEYQASQDKHKMYRALNIYRPSTSLSGKYLCRVSTIFNDAYKSATMLVYSPQRDMGISVGGTGVAGFVNVSCWASGVFPQPTLSLYYVERAQQKVEGLIVKKKFVQGAYEIHGYKIMKEKHVTSFFECELRIPNTEYIVRKGIVYETGSLQLQDVGVAEAVGFGSLRSHPLLIGLPLILLFESVITLELNFSIRAGRL